MCIRAKESENLIGILLQLSLHVDQCSIFVWSVSVTCSVVLGYVLPERSWWKLDVDMGQVSVEGGLGLGVRRVPAEIQRHVQAIRIDVRFEVASNVRRKARILYIYGPKKLIECCRVEVYGAGHPFPYAIIAMRALV